MGTSAPKGAAVPSHESSADDGSPRPPGEIASYAEHARYIEYLEKTNADWYDIREAYSRFGSSFPLGEAQWCSWIFCECEIDKNYALALCKRAVRDFIMIPIWIKYLELIEPDYILDGLLRAVKSGAAYHYQEGVKIWRTVIDRLIAIERPEMAIVVVALQLRTPLKGNGELPIEARMKESYENCRVFENDNPMIKELEWEGPQSVDELEEVIAAIERFEKKLVKERDSNSIGTLLSETAPDGLLFVYKSYAHYLEEKNLPGYALSVHERCVKEAFMDARGWKEYFAFRKRKRMPLLEATDRALRNMPLSEDLWIANLRTMEREELPLEDFMERYRCCPRKTVEIICCALQRCRRSARKCIAISSTAFNDIFSASTFKEGSYEWAEVNSLRAAMTSDVPLMENVLVHRGKEARWWMEYIDLLIGGDKKKIRVAFSNAVRTVSNTQIHDIARKWKRWEAVNGSLEDYEGAEEEVSSHLSSVWGNF